MALPAGVSVDYYTRLERGSLSGTSAEALRFPGAWAQDLSADHSDPYR